MFTVHMRGVMGTAAVILCLAATMAVGRAAEQKDAAAASREVIDDEHSSVGEMRERTPEPGLDAQADLRMRDDRPWINGHVSTSIPRHCPNFSVAHSRPVHNLASP